MTNAQFSPYTLLTKVHEILSAAGLEPQPVDGVDRVKLASDLIAAYGVEPERVLDLDGHASYHKRMDPEAY